MPKKIFTPEQIVAKLREIEVALANGKSVSLACRDAGIVDASYYRWRKEYGGLKIDQAKRMKDLERENARLKRVVAICRLRMPCCKRWPRETSKPATPSGRDPIAAALCCVGTRSVPGRGAATWHATLCGVAAIRRRCVDPRHRDVGQSIRSLRVSTHHRVVERGWLAGRQRSGATHMAS